MLKKFHKYPIILTSNGKKIGIMEFHKDVFREFDNLKIYQEQELLIDLSVSDCLRLDLPTEFGIVNFVYFKENEIVFEIKVNLKDNVTFDEEVLSNLDSYERLKLIVKKEIETLRGTDEEKEHQSNLILQCTINEKARAAMMAKIKHIALRTNFIPVQEVDDYSYRIFSELWGMGVLQELDDDNEVGEILVNATKHPEFSCTIYYYKKGIKHIYHKTIPSLVELERIFANAVAFEGKSPNAVERAIIEATRPNKDRVTIIQPDAAENYSLNIRKFANFIPSKESMMKSGTVNEDIELLLRTLVEGYANIGIGGPMNTGKTTMISYLLTYTRPIERKVVIAQVSETDIDRTLKGHDIILSRVDDEHGFSFEKHMRVGLRTTAERIIIPESRGSEFLSVVEACQKTKGNMFTGHAMDDKGFYQACVDMYLSNPMASNENSAHVRDKLTSAIDVIIVMRQVGGKIRIKSISEVIADEFQCLKEIRQLFVWQHDPEDPDSVEKGKYVRTKNRMSDGLKTRLNEKGVPLSRLESF